VADAWDAIRAFEPVAAPADTAGYVAEHVRPALRGAPEEDT
jgi:hypothetical protein